MLRVLAVLGVNAGCAPDLKCEPGPWHDEAWSVAPAVRASVREGCGLPDSDTEYRVFANQKLILEGSVEHFGRRHAVTKLGDGRVEIAIWDRACVVSTTGAECAPIDYKRWEH